MKTKLITGPTSLPVTLEEAKAHLRVLHSDEDADIELKLNTAIEKAEEITNRQLGVATYEGYMDAWMPSAKLPKPPFVEVVKVEYVDADGVKKLMPDYEVDAVQDPSVIYLNNFPSDMRTTGFNNVIITYKCGYEEVPAKVKSWVLLYMATLYEHRENLVEGTIVSDSKSRYFDHLLDSVRVRPV